MCINIARDAKELYEQRKPIQEIRAFIENKYKHRFQHPVTLEGAHADLDCTACHSSAQSLTYRCADCHQPPENHPEGACDTCHTPRDGSSRRPLSWLSHRRSHILWTNAMAAWCATIRLGTSSQHQRTIRTLSTSSAPSAVNSRRSHTDCFPHPGRTDAGGR
jgi:hypothetical protein